MIKLQMGIDVIICCFDEVVCDVINKLLLAYLAKVKKVKVKKKYNTYLHKMYM